ncbi:MAG: hypothetical protein JWM90_2417 [Thermoleophilia bacterium]|nr:hypothetical protein [Thermoleophilia bacterium]
MLALLVLTAGSSVAHAVVRPSAATTTYYSVYGATVPGIRASLDAKGPGGHDARANGYVAWRYSFVRSSRGCSIGSVSVTVRQRYTMPKWSMPTDAAADVRAAWDAYLVRLWVHEKGHGFLTRQAAAKVNFVLMRVGTRSTCSALDAAASSVAKSQMRLDGLRQAAYDARTSHGATQGATFG